MAKLLDKLYNRVIEGNILGINAEDKEVLKDALLSDSPNIIKIADTADITSVFDEVKTGDMINQGDVTVWIVVKSSITEVSLLGIDYNNDALYYSYYEYTEESWVLNQDSSFSIDKSSLGGGTKLYKHVIEYSTDDATVATVTLISTQQTTLIENNYIGASYLDEFIAGRLESGLSAIPDLDMISFVEIEFIPEDNECYINYKGFGPNGYVSGDHTYGDVTSLTDTITPL